MIISNEDIANDLISSISKLKKILEEEFLKDLIEVSFISLNFNMKSFQSLFKIKIKNSTLFLYSEKDLNISIDITRINILSYYGPGSLVIIFNDESTLTFRPMKNIKNLKDQPLSIKI